MTCGGLYALLSPPIESLRLAEEAVSCADGPSVLFEGYHRRRGGQFSTFVSEGGYAHHYPLPPVVARFGRRLVWPLTSWRRRSEYRGRASSTGRPVVDLLREAYESDTRMLWRF